MLNRKKIVNILGIGSLCLFLSGCAEESFLVQEDALTVIMEEESEQESGNTSMPGNMDHANDGEDAAVPESINNTKEIAVHICGAVNKPGVYYLREDQRVCDGIEKAGGFREDADQDYWNQALILEDGMKIDVPTKEEAEQMNVQEEAKKEDRSGKVDLNTADEKLLCTLPGIGESRAKSIIAYRNENGPFKKTEDIMKVSGIKEAAYEKIKDLIMVSG